MSYTAAKQKLELIYKKSEEIFLCLYSEGRSIILDDIGKSFTIKNQCIKFDVSKQLLQDFILLQEKISSFPWRRYVKYKRNSIDYIFMEYQELIIDLKKEIEAL